MRRNGPFRVAVGLSQRRVDGKFRNMNWTNSTRLIETPKAHCRIDSQAMKTEKTDGEFTPPAITSFSPARSGASSPRK